jgi:type VI protein secretion system component VasK
VNWVVSLWEKLLDFLPIERWVQAVGNVLRGLTLAFILIWVLLVMLVVNDWGFSQEQRIGLIGLFVLLLFLVVAVVIILAVQHYERLYSPYELSLQQGRRFGTESKRRRRSEAERLPRQAALPGLPAPPEPPAEPKQLQG